jgi:hypothetical protein
MRKATLILTAIIVLASIFAGCGGEKKLAGNYAETGVKLSYAPAVGKTFYYRSDSDDLTEFSEKGYSQSTLSKSTSYQAFVVDYVRSDTTSVTYSFLYEDVGVFQNEAFQKSEEQSDLIGQKLTIVIDPEGKLVSWSGLSDIESDGSGIDRGEMIASNYGSIFFDYFPPEPLKVGSKWTRDNAMNVTTKDGDLTQKTTKDYEVLDFVEYKGRPTAKCRVNITILNVGEGTVEDKDGKQYAYFNEGKGQGKGTVYFDFESGIPVYSTFNWIVDFTITSVDQETQEKNEFRYYNEQKVSYNLANESDVPKK